MVGCVDPGVPVSIDAPRTVLTNDVPQWSSGVAITQEAAVVPGAEASLVCGPVASFNRAFSSATGVERNVVAGTPVVPDPLVVARTKPLCVMASLAALDGTTSTGSSISQGNFGTKIATEQAGVMGLAVAPRIIDP
jgi:hypothetical protein